MANTINGVIFTKFGKEDADEINGFERNPTISGRYNPNQSMKSPETKIPGLAFLIIGLMLCGIGITWLLRPPQFQATARIQVQQTDYYISPFSPSMQSGFDPYFIQTTFEVMQSEVVLSNVVSTLDLNNKWGAKYNRDAPLKLGETINILKRNMILKPVRNTKLIAITVYSDDPKEAADIANAMADVYRNYRT